MFFSHSNALRARVQVTEDLAEVGVEDLEVVELEGLEAKEPDLEEEEDLGVRLNPATALQVQMPWAVVAVGCPATTS
jgi:hypothetical protein